MNLEILFKNLEAPKTNSRIASLHILNMVDEVRALDAISARVPLETEPRVAEQLMQVGRALNKLKREGYDTISEICKHFNVYSEVLSYANDDEISKIKGISFNLSNKKDGDIGESLVTAASMVIATQAFGIAGMMIGMNAPSMSSSLESTSDKAMKFSKRIRAMRPTNEDFSRWLPMLQDANPEQRRQGLIQLNNSNNPAALPHFAHAYVVDSENMVRETAKRLGKVLYWNALYYQMEQDGTIEKIMQDYAVTLGVTLPAKTSTQEMPVVPQESLEDIIRKAEAVRQKRRNK